MRDAEPLVDAEWPSGWGVYIRLDNDGRLLGWRGQPALEGEELPAFLPLLENDALPWPPPLERATELELNLPGNRRCILHGRFSRVGNELHLHALDITGLRQQDAGQRLAVRLQTLAAEVAGRFGLGDEEEDCHGLEYFLSGLNSTLGLLWSAVLIRDGSSWRLAAGRGLGHEQASGLLGAQPRVLTDACRVTVLGNLSVLLVPAATVAAEQAYLLGAMRLHGEWPRWSVPLWKQLANSVLLAFQLSLYTRRSHQERTRYGWLQKTLGCGWWERDVVRGRWSLSASLVRLLGLRSEGDWLECLHPADLDWVKARVQALEMGSIPAFECTVRMQIHGDWRWVQVEAGSVGREQVMGVIRDVHEAEEQRVRLQLAKTRLESLVEGVPAILYIHAWQQGAWSPQFCSASMLALLGWNLDELDSWLALVHPEDQENYLLARRQLLQQGKVTCEYRLRDRQGRYHWMLDEAKLLRDEIGIPTEALGICLDVTEEREARARLEASEERYRLLVDDSPAMICRYRPDLTLTYANPPLLNYLQAPCADKPLQLRDYMSEGQLAVFHQAVERLSPEEPLATLEICLELPGMRQAWWLWSMRGLFDEQGALCEVQAVGRDDTELYRSRQVMNQSAKMATLGEISTAIAHEISQPLNVMRVALSNLSLRVEQGTLNDDYLLGKLERIEGQIQRAARIVEHMRVFGRRSEGRSEPFQAALAVNGAVELVRPELERCGIGLHLQLGELPLVKGHGDQLEQVLINLLINARDAFAERVGDDLERLLVVRVAVQERQLLIEVEDNAGGVPEELLERIFEPFFTTKPAGKGTGLGLSVSYGIIQRMGGQLAVRNQGCGACFSIRLPLCVEALPAPA